MKEENTINKKINGKRKDKNDMSGMQKILMIMGIMYTAIGGIITVSFIAMGMPGFFVLIPLLFLLLGVGFIISIILSFVKKNKITANGHKYAAKVYSYVDNTSYVINGSYTVNLKVHYFDENHIEREAIIPTEFEKGSNMYPIGMTIDIFEYQGKFGFDPKSVRNEIIEGESELMDDKPVSPEQVKLIAATCPSCGASYQATAGYSNRCPYCGGYQNA